MYKLIIVDDELGSAKAMSRFINKDFKNIKDYELLEYNPLGESKNIALGNQKQDFGKMANSFEILKTYAKIN